MKKVLLLGVISFIAMQMNAQKIVSTSSENKKVILEEFTGIHCGYCPDGHKRANDLVAANSGKIILVNIHSGGYATPGAGEPDFRTSTGDAIDGYTGGGGYPKGMVNRVTPNTVMQGSTYACDRGQWTGEAGKITSQTSPVNIGVKATIDPKTRELTADVEVYYTANSPKATNYLTVYLLEDGILGPQSDYGNYNPTNWVTVNGKKLYKHNHVLRMLLTSADFGDAVDSTRKGQLTSKTYKVTLPAQLKSIDVKFNKLTVVAFVSEGKGNILSGGEAPVDFDAALKTDLALSNQTATPTGLCVASLHPKVEVVNNMSNVITTFDITANINGTDYTKTFTGSLAKGAKTTMDWGDITLTSGGYYNLNITGFKNVNNDSLFDTDESNDNYGLTGIGFAKNAVTSVLGGFDGTMPANFAFDLTQNPRVSMLVGTTTGIGADGSKGAVLFNIHSSWNVAGLPGDILFGEADLSNIQAPMLTYFYAYSDKGNVSASGSYGGTAPTIQVAVSEDCGVNWKKISDVTCTETGKPTAANALYVPKSGEYVWVGVNMAKYKGKSVLVKVSGIPGDGGNAMWIDQINLDEASSIANANNDYKFEMYPNPAIGQTAVNFNVKGNKAVTLEVYNMMGQKVATIADGKTLTEGNYNLDVNTSNLAQGMYMVTLKVGDQVANQRLSVIK
ncbi:MAG: Omp28-related outer membrane protein [Bacteroidetes bacterium]|nr:Omp28-related outer membrane protein [Bacteroidota bacterium]